MHAYGPHIFHTDNQRVIAFVNRFGTMLPYRHRVKTTHRGRVYSLPINLHTINQFFGAAMSPQEARAFIAGRAVTYDRPPANFEEQALSMIGAELYEAFFKGYTEKQWGLDPSALPASVLKRLPVRFTYDDSYFHHRYQAMPADGYTEIVRAMLDHPNIAVHLGVSFEAFAEPYDHLVYSGPIDRYFAHRIGRLAYRTLSFERFYAEGDHQGIAIMNYADRSAPMTRITEHKHFAPGAPGDVPRTVCFREFSRPCEPGDIPYYPIRLAKDKALLADYVAKAEAETGVTFVGRLGTYQYIDMDVSIARGLETADHILGCAAARRPIAPFVHRPI